VAISDQHIRLAPRSSIARRFLRHLIRDRVWRSPAQLAIVECTTWFNHQRLHSSVEDHPPVEHEFRYAAVECIVGHTLLITAGPNERGDHGLATPGRLELLREQGPATSSSASHVRGRKSATRR